MPPWELLRPLSLDDGSYVDTDPSSGPAPVENEASWEELSPSIPDLIPDFEKQGTGVRVITSPNEPLGAAGYDYGDIVSPNDSAKQMSWSWVDELAKYLDEKQKEEKEKKKEDPIDSPEPTTPPPSEDEPSLESEDSWLDEFGQSQCSAG